MIRPNLLNLVYILRLVYLKQIWCGGLNIKTIRSPALVLLRIPIYIKSARVLRYNRGLSAKVLGGV